LNLLLSLAQQSYSNDIIQVNKINQKNFLYDRNVEQNFSDVISYSDVKTAISQENKDFATGRKTCYLHEIECADSESEVKICLGRLDLKL
jgi:hypothetical protein